MARRRDAGSQVLAQNEWSTVWRCGCGYGNAGRDRCLICGSLAPAEVEGSEGLYREAEVIPLPARGPVATAGRKAGRTVAAVIVVNLLIQVSQIVWFAQADIERATAIRIALFTGIGYYTLVALWVLFRSSWLGVTPQVGRARALVGAAEGFVVGGAIATFLFAVLRLVEGRPVLDPTSSLLAVQGSVASLLLGIVLLVVAAPVVEELVFRGFLAEALRDRGRRAAVLLSAAAFSLSHLRLSQFRYYLLMGVVLGLVYWRRGLVGSVTAHATFNGMLLLLAVAASHGPAAVVAVDTATVAVPATYQTSEAVVGDDLVAIGPLGAQVEFTHVDVPLAPPADALARDLARGVLPLPPGLVLDHAAVDVVDLPAGRAVSVMATVGGERGRMVVVPTEGRIWVAVFRSDGTDASFRDFQDMLLTWRLPGS